MQYHVFGIGVLSDVEVPQLQPGRGPVDARIRLGRTPSSIENPTDQTAWYQRNDMQCLFSIEGVARYYIEKGQTIIVEPQPGVDPQTIALWLLGSAMAALLHQRGVLPLHASAIETPCGAVLIGGNSGTGKSTTAAGLLQRGYRLIADDVSAITLDAQGTATVAPAYPQQKLWQDTLDNLELSSRPLDRLRFYETKYALGRQEHFCDAARPIRAVYVLAGFGADLMLQPIEGMAKLMVLRQQIYRPFFMPQPPQSAGLLTTLTTLAAQAYVAEVVRPEQGFQLDELINRLISDFAHWSRSGV